MKRTISLILCLLMLLTLFSACDLSIGNKTDGGDNSGLNDNTGNGGSSDSLSDNIPRGELSLYPAYVQMPLDFNVYIDVETGQEVEWSSSDLSVATIGPDGMISGVAEGEAVITATVKGKPSVTSSCGVRVIEAVYDEDEEETGSILIWEDEAPEPTDWDALEAEAGITPTMAQADTPKIELLPAVYTGNNPGGAVSLAAGNGKMKSPPIELKPQKGKKVVRPKRKDTEQLLKKGFVWTMRFNGLTEMTHINTNEIDRSKYGLIFTLSGKSQMVGGTDIFGGSFEGYAKFCEYVDTSDPVAKVNAIKATTKVLGWALKFEGNINNFNFVFTPTDGDLVPLVHISEGQFIWTYYETNIYRLADGNDRDISGDDSETLLYKLFVNPVTYEVKLAIERPYYTRMNSKDPWVMFNGYISKTPDVYDGD